MRTCILFIVDGANRAKLVQLVRGRGWHVTRTIEARKAGARQALEELEQIAHQGAASAIILDTLEVPGVGLQRLLRSLDVLGQLSVEVVSLEQPWFSTCGDQQPLLRWVVATADREQREKIRSSLERVRAEGRQLGRPRAVVPVEQVLRMRAEGASLRAIARAVGLGAATVHRFLAAHERVASASNPRVR